VDAGALITPGAQELRDLAERLRRNVLRPRSARTNANQLDPQLIQAMDRMLGDVPFYSHREIAQALGVHEGRVSERYHARWTNRPGTPRIQERFKP
jgi:hypothetical protein